MPGIRTTQSSSKVPSTPTDKKENFHFITLLNRNAQLEHGSEKRRDGNHEA